MTKLRDKIFDKEIAHIDEKQQLLVIIQIKPRSKQIMGTVNIEMENLSLSRAVVYALSLPSFHSTHQSSIRMQRHCMSVVPRAKPITSICEQPGLCLQTLQDQGACAHLPIDFKALF